MSENMRGSEVKSENIDATPPAPQPWQMTDWFWCQKRLFGGRRSIRHESWRDSPAHRLRWDGVAVYVTLCSYLGRDTGPAQTGFTRVGTLGSVLGMGKARCWTLIEDLVREGLICLRKNEEEAGCSREADPDGFAYLLCDRPGAGALLPRRWVEGEFFWMERGMLDVARSLEPSGVAAYALLSAMADRERKCHVSQEFVEKQLDLYPKQGGEVLERLETAGLLRITPRGPRRTHGYELITLTETSPALPKPVENRGI